MSLGETTLGELLKEQFPHYKIIPQHTIKTKSRTLFLDFYLPHARLAFEADGRQHEQYVRHYHKDEMGFKDSQYRDSIKEQWCNDNGVRLIRFSHRDKITLDTLRKKITQIDGS